MSTPHPDPWDAAAERARADIAELCARLGLDELTVATLAGASRRVIGRAQTDLCLEIIAGHRLSRRYWQLGNWAALVAAFTLATPTTPDDATFRATRALPADWWGRPLTTYSGETTSVTANDVLAGIGEDPQYRMGSGWDTPLDALAARAADDAIAPSTQDIDLNWPGEHLVEPRRADGAPLAVGDSVTVRYDAGGLVDGVVTIVDEHTARLRVDLDSARYTFPAEINWCVDVTWRRRRIHVPGERPGTGTDPYARPAPTTPDVLRFLETATELGEAALQDLRDRALHGPAPTLGDVHDIECRYDTLRHPQPGLAHDVSRALAGWLDGRLDEVAKAERHLRGDYGRPDLTETE